MLKFLRWFMKLFRPDSSRYVKNIQDDSRPAKRETKETRGKITKQVYERDAFYWLLTSRIIDVDKNSQGLTSSIKLASGNEFTLLAYKGKFALKVKKQGLTRLNCHIELSLEEEDQLFKQVKDLMSDKAAISILHVDRFGDGFLIGESNGLSILEIDNNKVVFEGIEDNVFYEMTGECLKKVIPN
jgi:hypothetical protein